MIHGKSVGSELTGAPLWTSRQSMGSNQGRGVQLDQVARRVFPASDAGPSRPIAGPDSPAADGRGHSPRLGLGGMTSTSALAGRGCGGKAEIVMDLLFPTRAPPAAAEKRTAPAGGPSPLRSDVHLTARAGCDK